MTSKEKHDYALGFYDGEHGTDTNYIKTKKSRAYQRGFLAGLDARVMPTYHVEGRYLNRGVCSYWTARKAKWGVGKVDDNAIVITREDKDEGD